MGELLLTHALYLKMLRIKQGGIKYHFLVFGMTPPGNEPWFPGPLANTLTIMPMGRWSNKMVHSFSKGINSKVNVIERLEFELTYFDIVVQHVSYYAKGTPSMIFEISLNYFTLYKYNLVLAKSLTISMRVDLEVMAMKEYSIFLQTPELEPHHQMLFSVISVVAEMQSTHSITPANWARDWDSDIIV